MRIRYLMIATTVAAALAILTPPAQDVLNSAPVPYSASQGGIINNQDAALVQQGLTAARARDVVGTQSIMARISDPTARKLVEWALVDTSDEQMSYSDLALAQTDLASWPRGDSRRAAGERALDMAGQSPDAVLAFFNGTAPTTAQGAIALAGALEQTGRRQEAQALIRDWWRTQSFEEAQQSRIYSRWSGWLTSDDHVARLDMLLLGPHGPATRAMVALVPADRQAVARSGQRPGRGAGAGAPAALRRSSIRGLPAPVRPARRPLARGRPEHPVERTPQLFPRRAATGERSRRLRRDERPRLPFGR